MNRAKAILSQLRLTNSLLSTRLLSDRSLICQVTTNQNLLFFPTQTSPVFQLILDNKWSKDLETSLSNANPELTHELVMNVLKGLDKDPEKASAFFNWVCNKNKFRPNRDMYNLALCIFANKKTVNQFWATVEKMKGRRFYDHIDVYLPVRTAFYESRMSKHARSWTVLWLRKMTKRVFTVVTEEEEGWGPNVERMLSGLKILLSEDFVLRVFQELKYYPLRALCFFRWVSRDLGFEHNDVTYNEICFVLCGEYSMRLFWSVFNEMKSLGHKMDRYTYNSLLYKLCYSNMLKDAVELYEAMIFDYDPDNLSAAEGLLILEAIVASKNVVAQVYHECCVYLKIFNYF